MISDVFQIDFKAEIQTASQSTPQVGCRVLASVLACAQVLCKIHKEPSSNEVSKCS